MIHVGTAGWTIPRIAADAFPSEGGALQRYAAIFGAAEINSSFHRSHKPVTYARWAATTPEDFRFSVKLPRTITHEARLVDAGAPLARFLSEARELGPKLGPLLIQLPPSFVFYPDVAEAFLDLFRNSADEPAAFEPRHPTWFCQEAEALLERFEVARIAADPAVVPAAAQPGGWRGLTYTRLHGSPHMYATAYASAAIARVADGLKADPAAEAWCMFDNTMLGAAALDALELKRRLTGEDARPPN